MGWEYQTVQIHADTGLFFAQGGTFDDHRFRYELNRLGWDGWELVSVFDTNHIQGGTRYIVAVFKRPLTDERRRELLQHRT